MALTTCKECGGELSTKAVACPKCGAKVRRTSVAAWGCLTLLAFFFVVGVIGGVLGDGSSVTDPSQEGPTIAEPDQAIGAAGGSPTAEPSPTDNLTPAQRNAVRSANSYLRMSGFSRQGLIDQLSSEFGDQYTVRDATVAVDNLDVDWNAQAARSAASYLQMSGFSCQGLIDQLSSSYGDKYTVGQATEGARRAGAC